jgi:Rhodanese-related sulfurtransferase
LTTEVPSYPSVQREPREWPADRFATADEVARSPAMIFDARTAERYAHGDPAIDPRPGHIPGALSAPWGGNLGADGRFLGPDVLRERFPVEDAIAYCGSGVTACHDLLAMELAGVAHTALYPGSWSQWGADPACPAAEGLAP